MVTASPDRTPGRKTVLIHSPNWLGDVVMAWPAFHLWRQSHPDAKVIVLAKKSVAGLWRYARGVDEVIVLAPGKEGAKEAVRSIREARCDEAILFPLSFRSAWLVWRGGVPRLRGVPGQFRSWMLTEKVSITDLATAHQAREYMRIAGVADPDEIPSPSLALDPSRLPIPPDVGVAPADCLIVLPGAARGDSKRWPAPSFAQAIRTVLRNHPGWRVLVCGTPGEATACAEVAALLGPVATDLAGKTKLPELAALIARSRGVCCNDSGGMHLATALGVPVVAVFGITDPSKTGPLGRSRVVAAKGVRVSRAIPRESPEATRALASIAPDRVSAALEELLAP